MSSTTITFSCQQKVKSNYNKKTNHKGDINIYSEFLVCREIFPRFLSPILGRSLCGIAHFFEWTYWRGCFHIPERFTREVAACGAVNFSLVRPQPAGTA